MLSANRLNGLTRREHVLLGFIYFTSENPNCGLSKNWALLDRLCNLTTVMYGAFNERIGCACTYTGYARNTITDQYDPVRINDIDRPLTIRIYYTYYNTVYYIIILSRRWRRWEKEKRIPPDALYIYMTISSYKGHRCEWYIKNYRCNSIRWPCVRVLKWNCL